MDRDSLSIFFVLFFICIHGVYTHLRQCTVYTYGVNGSRDWAIFLFFSLQSQSSSLAPSRLLSLTARPPFLLSQSLFLFKGLTKSLKKRGKCRFYRIGIGYNRKGQKDSLERTKWIKNKGEKCRTSWYTVRCTVCMLDGDGRLS